MIELIRCKIAENLRIKWYQNGNAAEYEKHVNTCETCKQRHSQLNALARAMDERLPIFRKDE